MAKIPRVRERTATQAELEEDRRRALEAKPRIFATVEEFEKFCDGSQPRETVDAMRAEPDARERLLAGIAAATALNLRVRP